MPAGATYEPIATASPSGSTTINFASLGSYTDIRLSFVINTSANGSPIMRFNGDTGTNYSRLYIYGNGATATSSNSTNQTFVVLTTPTALTANLMYFVTVDIFSVSGSTNKTCLVTFSGDTNGSGNVTKQVNLWRSTSAITSIDLTFASTGSYTTGTTATLYGIKSA
jgi:hypothetical protein